ncbi:Uncharacterized oxidoreductase [hydrothermal vent metagenome]|uniref:Uncharacterized oxidoreductase n=1 Tax=hydrothermal vent metagenome TaxID=652676 RepID=A0A3B0SJH4_9ZZZZ
MKKAVIAGAGIGGLSAALCLHKFGWDVELLEQAPELGDVGAGIQISPNGMKILRALGLEKELMAQCVAPRASQIRMGQSGRVIMTNSMAGFKEKYGAPYLHIHRADLIAVLHNAVEQRLPGAIRTSRTVVGYGQSEAKVHAKLDDGSKVTGDIVIGADGIKSAIRDQVLGPDRPRFTGNLAWRAVVPVEKLGRNVPLPVATVWLGEGKHAVTYLLRGGKLANFVGVVERGDWQKESWSEQGSREQAMADFAGWHPTITTLIEQADTHFRWALFDREPLDQWSDGRVTLVGDACHPMLPFMAQGAVQAIEDGYVLAQSLASHDSTNAALTNYFSERRNRTARVQKAARTNMNIFHQRSPIGKLATFGSMWVAGKIDPEVAETSLDWLYGHDVTSGAKE